MRSRQTSRARSSMRLRGRIFDACTIAASRPASTDSWRKTELSTWRAAGLRPKETLDRPRMVETPGSSALIAPDPLERLDAVAPALLHAGRKREGQRVEEQVLGSEAVAVDRDVVDGLARRAASTRRCGPAPPRRCRCTRPRRRSRGARRRKVSRRVPGASPSSRFTELRTGRPPSNCSAASATGPSVVSTMSGTLDWVAKRLRHLGHVGDPVGARVVDADVDQVRPLLHLVAGHGHAGVPVGVEHGLAELLASRWRWCARRPRGTKCPGGRAPTCRWTPPRARARGWRACGRAPRAALDDRRQVGGGGAAAPADRGHAELGDEAVVELGQLLGREVVVHLAVDHRRQAGVGQARDRDRAVGREVAERLAHLGRPGRAVEADDVDLHGVERGRGPRRSRCRAACGR